MTELVPSGLPGGAGWNGRFLVHRTNGGRFGVDRSIFGMGRASCPVQAAYRAIRAERAWRDRMARREAARAPVCDLPLWRVV